MKTFEQTRRSVVRRTTGERRTGMETLLFLCSESELTN
jgi:hypothetical protein